MLSSPMFRFLGFKGWEWLGVALLAAVLVVATAPYWRFTVDDAFITFRYSSHLAHGQGITWNPGEPEHVEGYTSFAWLLLNTATIGLGAGAAPHIPAKVLGLLFGFLLCLAFLRTARRTFPGGTLPAPVLVLSLFLLAGPPFAGHCLSGLETMLFCLLIFLLFSQALEGAPHPRIFALTGLAAGLTRPEGAVVFLLHLGWVIWGQPRERRIACLKAAALLFLLPGAAYLAWKLGYYGDILPNTFRVKGHFSSSTSTMLRQILVYHAIPLVLVLGTLPFIPSLRRPFRLFLLTAIPFAMYLFTDQVMGYFFRYHYPLIPILLLLLVPLADRLVGEAWRKPLSWAALAAMALFAGMASFQTWYRWESRGFFTGVSQTVQNYSRMGQALAPFADRGYTLALSEAGVISYYSGWKVLDFGKLNSRLFTRGDPKEITVYLERNPPDAILYMTQGPLQGARGVFSGVMGRFPYQDILEFRNGMYTLHLFVREDLPDIFSILNALDPHNLKQNPGL